tara:strand:- start:780 stop:2297 length:1518 start_codon:yes stop_codon:yes gene_type:complete
MNLNIILKEKKIFFEFFIFISLISVSLLFLFTNYQKLGVFADDIGTIYFLKKINTLKELVIYSHNWDAARDLHLVWQKLFIILSKTEIIQELHYYQILFYSINALILYLILKEFKITKNISYVCIVFFLFFPLYSEVVFWTHAFTMVLISTTFFLLFILVNIKLSEELKTTKKYVYELLSFLFLFLNLFTYEQSIVVSLFIIVLREFNLIKRKKKINKENYLSIFLYFSLIILFSYYKLYEAGTFTKNSQLYFTGSKLSNNDQIIKNIIHGYGLFIYNLIYLNLDNFNLIKNQKVLAVIITVLLLIILFFTQKRREIIDFKLISLKIFICFMCYTLSLLPLYIHYISDRHFYIPSVFAIIGISFILHSFFNIIGNRKLSNIIFNSIICLFLLNVMLNFDSQRNQYIENYRIKYNFYKELSQIDNIKNNKYIILNNFPDLYKKTIFFAHEQREAMRLKFENEDLPLVIKNISSKKENSIYINFIEINNNEIRYKINDRKITKTTKS